MTRSSSGGVIHEPCTGCRGSGMVHDLYDEEDNRWDDYPCEQCNGLGHIILGPEREWVDCVWCGGSRINVTTSGPCGPCDGRGRVIRTSEPDRTMHDDTCYRCGGPGCLDCGYSGLLVVPVSPSMVKEMICNHCDGHGTYDDGEFKDVICYRCKGTGFKGGIRPAEKALYRRKVVARTEVQLEIDVWIEKKPYQIPDQLIFETKVVGGNNHPLPRDVLRIDVPCGTVLEGNGSYELKVPPREIYKDRIVQVKEYVNEGRDVMAFLVFFYSLLRWVMETRKKVPTTDSELRFSLLELD